MVSWCLLHLLQVDKRLAQKISSYITQHEVFQNVRYNQGSDPFPEAFSKYIWRSEELFRYVLVSRMHTCTHTSAAFLYKKFGLANLESFHSHVEHSN